MPRDTRLVEVSGWREWEFHWGQRTYVMGVINVTPDSFSGDGLGHDIEGAIDLGLKFIREGADILDVGGESSRPVSSARVESRMSGSVAQTSPQVSLEEELVRVLPVIQGLSAKSPVPLSIDTTKAKVAQEAIKAGASMINDVWGLKSDPAIADVAAAEGVPLILNHHQDGNQYTKNVVEAVIESLAWSCERALSAGVPASHIIVDPGFGFGKTPQHNLEIIRRLKEFRVLGHPVLLGTSRKSTIGRVLQVTMDERLEGTAATVALAIANGVDVVRVHDVQSMVRVARMADAIVRGWLDSDD